MQPKAAKQSTKTHRRSRTGMHPIDPPSLPPSLPSLTPLQGCFTCRLRRKKCDEGKPACRACKHLGLSCEYKRPQWWGNVEQRKRQKDTIKTLIKRTKLTEKAVHLSPAHSADSPPELSRSLPNSESLSDNRHRSVSVDSGYTLYETDLDSHAGLYQQHHHYHHQQHFVQSPYEYDTFPKQESPYSSGFPTPRRASTASFASSTLRRSSVVEQPPFLRHPSIVESISSEDPNSYFDFGQYAPLENSPPPILHQQPQPVYIPVEGGDQQLLNHFLNSVQHLIFPILDLHSTARQEVIIPALAENESFRHCCLSIAALHIKTTQHLTGADAECVDQDITRHRFKTISGLCEALARDSDHLQILEATLSMILFQVRPTPPPHLAP